MIANLVSHEHSMELVISSTINEKYFTLVICLLNVFVLCFIKYLLTEEIGNVNILNVAKNNRIQNYTLFWTDLERAN